MAIVLDFVATFPDFYQTYVSSWRTYSHHLATVLDFVATFPDFYQISVFSWRT
jgi:predicted protein tyrosine phosphatase